MSERGETKAGKTKSAATLEASGHDRLIDCALDSFAMWGFEGATVRKIAAQAQVDPTLIHYHFGSKLGLWKAVVDRIAAQVEAIIARFAPGGGSRALVNDLVDSVCAHPNLAFFLIKEVSRQTDRFDYFFQALVAPLRDQMVPIIRQAGGEARDGEQAELIHFTLMGAIVMAIVTRSFGANPAAEDHDAKFRADLQDLLHRLVE